MPGRVRFILNTCNVVIMNDTTHTQGRRGPRRARPTHREQRTTPEQRRQITAWFAGRLPDDWFDGPAEVVVDGDEILVTGTLPPVELPGGGEPSEQATADAARVGGFREDTRAHRMRIADEAQAAFGRTVSWGARCGSTDAAFTTLGVPVMTRLRLRERQVLDTLIDAGIARSRSEALAWCVALVGDHEGSWIDELRDALVHVEKVRAKGPGTTPAPDDE
jgi:hypothetical protein